MNESDAVLFNRLLEFYVSQKPDELKMESVTTYPNKIVPNVSLQD